MNIAIIGEAHHHTQFAALCTNASSHNFSAFAGVNELVGRFDLIVDFCFESNEPYHQQLQNINTNVFVAAVSANHLPFARFNGWYGSLEKAPLEVANCNAQIEEICNTLGIAISQVPDDIGLLTPKVISMIINEAYLALEEGVSTKQEIDTAMKLGTNYPFGPFEWAEKIGKREVANLLQLLAAKDKSFAPSKCLLKEIENGD